MLVNSVAEYDEDGICIKITSCIPGNLKHGKAELRRW
jgi:hypothetical protein